MVDEHDHEYEHGGSYHCDHSCDSDHPHDHSHGIDCDCECNQEDIEAEDIVNNALIVSRKGTVSFNTPVKAEKALASISANITSIAEQLAVDGFIAGHIKALVECSAGKATVSITRLDTIDVVEHNGWHPEEIVTSCILSTNFLSIENTNVPVDKLINEVLFC